MIEIRNIGADNPRDVNIPNEPFALWGRMIPALENGVWTYRVQRDAHAREMCFPDYPYAPADGGIYLGAYDAQTCVGLAVLREEMFRYLYLEDLKVCQAYRRRGVGGMLIDACMRTARDGGKQGVYVVAQDNILSACLFYLRRGFEIGGFNNRVYRGTSQQEKSDIFFYRDCDE